MESEQCQCSSSNNTIESDKSFSEGTAAAYLPEILTSHGLIYEPFIEEKLVPAVSEGRSLVIEGCNTLAQSAAITAAVYSFVEKHCPAEVPCSALVLAADEKAAGQICDTLGAFGDRFNPLNAGACDPKRNEFLASNKGCLVLVGSAKDIRAVVERKSVKIDDCCFLAIAEPENCLSRSAVWDSLWIFANLPRTVPGLAIGSAVAPFSESVLYTILESPEKISVASGQSAEVKTSHYYFEVDGSLLAKPRALCDFMRCFLPRRTVIYCGGRSDAKLIETWLKKCAFPARRIDSHLPSANCDEIVERFTKGEFGALLLSDVTARGLEFREIDLVVNFTIPEQMEVYEHRIKAAKAALSLVAPRDFGPFHTLSKSLGALLKKMLEPSKKELLLGDTVHFWGLLNSSKEDLAQDYLDFAKMLLGDFCGIEDINPKLLRVIGRLYQLTLVSIAAREHKSLDEELTHNGADSSYAGRDRRSEHDSERSDRDRYRNRESRDGREDRGGRNRRDDRDSHRDRDSYRDRNRDRPRHQREERTAINRDGDTDREVVEPDSTQTLPAVETSPAIDGREQSESGSPNDEIRLYVGQGTKHGMTPKLFVDLASHFADIAQEDIKKVSFRDYYGFVDALRPQAQALVNNLNGIEYNNLPLPVEIAAVLSSQRRESGYDNRGRQRNRQWNDRSRQSDRRGRRDYRDNRNRRGR